MPIGGGFHRNLEVAEIQQVIVDFAEATKEPSGFSTP